MAAHTTCSQHARDPAGWICRSCERDLCVKCATRRIAGAETAIVCAVCGGFADPILVRGEHTSLATLVPAAFVYPFSARGFMALGVWGAIFGLLGLGGTIGRAGSGLLFLAYLIAVVRGTAHGNDEVPEPRGTTGLLPMAAAFVRVVIGAGAAALPLLAYLRLRPGGSPQSYLEDPVVYLTGVIGLAFAPMMCAGGAAGAPLLVLLNPIRLIQSIGRTLADYAIAVGTFAALGLGAALIFVLSHFLVRAIGFPVIPAMYAGAACAYLPLVSARVLGLFVLSRGDELVGGIGTGYRVPVLGAVMPPLEVPKPGTKSEVPPVRTGSTLPGPVRAPDMGRLNSQSDFQRPPPVPRLPTPLSVPIRATTPSMVPVRPNNFESIGHTGGTNPRASMPARRISSPESPRPSLPMAGMEGGRTKTPALPFSALHQTPRPRRTSLPETSLPPLPGREPSPVVRITTQLDVEIRRPGADGHAIGAPNGAGQVPWHHPDTGPMSIAPSSPHDSDSFEIVPIASASRAGEIEGVAVNPDYVEENGAVSLPPDSQKEINVYRGVNAPNSTPAMQQVEGVPSIAPPPAPGAPTDEQIRAIADSHNFERLTDAYRFRKGAVTVLEADELWQVAQIAKNRTDLQTASHALRRLGMDHPNSPRAPAALLDASVLLGQNLKQPDASQRLLHRIIQYYPGTVAAADAARMLRAEH